MNSDSNISIIDQFINKYNYIIITDNSSLINLIDKYEIINYKYMNKRIIYQYTIWI